MSGGQYGPGMIDGKPVPGYREEEQVDPDSNTETYVALKLYIDNFRWSGVPFYLRTGKRLPVRSAEIVIRFREQPGVLYFGRGVLRTGTQSAGDQDSAGRRGIPAVQCQTAR